MFFSYMTGQSLRSRELVSRLSPWKTINLIYIKGRGTEIKKGLPFCVLLHKWPAPSKVRVKIQEFHLDCPSWVPDSQALGPSSTALPGTFVGSWTGCGTASTQIGCWCTDSGLTCLHPSTGPEIRWFCVVVSVLPWCAMYLHRTAA